ncbi:tryptophan-rich sensory protein [Sinomonas halotolerans]|uniref:Tryptophan-rich sensory protein n=1 Tax=Sinomonas halotolerans TaxID=1644133 RepID=A0ABU9X3W7_9MICC
MATMHSTAHRTAGPGWWPAALTAASALAALALAALGSGAFGGTPVQDAAGGYLSATATPLSPATRAFSIWSVIYAGLLAYAVWQLLPAARLSPRQRAVRPWAAASMLLNAAWLWASQAGSLPLTLMVMLVLLAVLCRLFALLLATPPASRTELVLADGTFGLYLGWISVATAANTAAAAAAALGIRPGEPSPALPAGIPAEPAAVVVLAVGAAVGVALALTGRAAPLLSIAWGLAWIGVGRLAGEPAMPTVGAAAFAAAAVVLAAGLAVRLRGGRAPLAHGPRKTTAGTTA